MVRLICTTCGKYHYLSSINDFSKCDCGKSLSPVICELIDEVENTIVEINAKIVNHSDSELCGKFNIDFI